MKKRKRAISLKDYKVFSQAFNSVMKKTSQRRKLMKMLGNKYDEEWLKTISFFLINGLTKKDIIQLLKFCNTDTGRILIGQKSGKLTKIPFEMAVNREGKLCVIINEEARLRDIRNYAPLIISNKEKLYGKRKRNPWGSVCGSRKEFDKIYNDMYRDYVFLTKKNKYKTEDKIYMAIGNKYHTSKDNVKKIIKRLKKK